MTKSNRMQEIEFACYDAVVFLWLTYLKKENQVQTFFYNLFLRMARACEPRTRGMFDAY